DFHIHSHYSLATSRHLIPQHTAWWAYIKGISVVGTGDFTHPSWLAQLKEVLEPVDGGLLQLKKGFPMAPTDPAYASIVAAPALSSRPSQAHAVRFILTAEISSIYKQNGRVRKVHSILFAPDFETVEKIQKQLIHIGCNITSDGRPIIGISAHDLLELALDVSDKIFFIPAHIWTPWFSLLGEKSGFDSIEECFGDLSEHIHAVETGLSSDPPMNWLCSILDRVSLVSNSDAHSPDRLGRNATVFATQPCYEAILQALKSGDLQHYRGTINLYPQEGKYHYDGHRKCSVVYDPLQSLQHDFLCEKCGRRITIGVMHRVAQIADRSDLSQKSAHPPLRSIIPLREIISQIRGVAPSAKQCDQLYFETIGKLGTELSILLDAPVAAIAAAGYPLLAEAIDRMRNRHVHIQPGYDGEYGTVTAFAAGELERLTPQQSIFSTAAPPVLKLPSRELISFDLKAFQAVYEQFKQKQTIPMKQEQEPDLQEKLDLSAAEPVAHEQLALQSAVRQSVTCEPVVRCAVPQILKRQLNSSQAKAATHGCGPAVVLAGPGCGKTAVLTYRIGYLIEERGVDPQSIQAITFTQKAAREIAQRLASASDPAAGNCGVAVSTFHGLGYRIMKEYGHMVDRRENFLILDEEDRLRCIEKECGVDKRRVKKIADAIRRCKEQLKSPQEITDETIRASFQAYENRLISLNVCDIDDLVYQPVAILQQQEQVATALRNRIRWILIDEYQDINYAQFQLIRLLTTPDQVNLFVIGDPNQAIYGFRGSDVSFINTFIETFPGAALYYLDTSYRCSDTILNASHQMLTSTTTLHGDTPNSQQPLIKGNSDDAGLKVSICAHASDTSEAVFIARTIETMIGGVSFFSMDSNRSDGHGSTGITALSDFAVLCRTHRQLEIISQELQKHSIPCQSYDDAPLYRSEPVKSIITVAKMVWRNQNPGLLGFLNSKVTITKSLLEKTRELLLGSKSSMNPLQVFSTLIAAFFPAQKLKKEPSVQELLELCGQFSSVESLLEFIETGTSVDLYTPQLDAVSLLTLHGAKGLEFACVFIAGCEEGLIPYTLLDNHRSGDGGAEGVSDGQVQKRCDRQEERRLLYVGMTRAKRFLYLTHAAKRLLFGKPHAMRRSSFLDAIEQELIAIETVKARQKKSPAPVSEIQMSLFD
ncbi:MAG: UvrD-helicase domain-containing protein, partial [Chitinivibrionales bacterium]|nr:UvrD-helicase domain-containing protein [Chitinivibrionales bacterium]